MNRTTIAAAAALALSIHCGISLAAQQRSFVSTGGSDAATCTLAAPCRSFGAALPHTLDNGEIVALDSGGYGAVVIDKSVELIAAPGVYAAITASSGTGVQVVAPADKVAIRGIAINGLGSGQFGIDVQSGDVVVERCRIANFMQDGVRSNGSGLVVRDTEIRDNSHNGITITGGDVTIERTAVSGSPLYGIDLLGLGTSVRATLRDIVVSGNGSDGMRLAGMVLATMTSSEIVRNGLNGIWIDGSVGAASTWLAMDRSNVSHNQFGIQYQVTGGAANVNVSITRSVVAQNFTGLIGGVSGNGFWSKVIVTDSVFDRNSQTAMSVDGTGAEMTIASNTITGSALGIVKNGNASVFTPLSNNVRGNMQDVVNGPLTSFGGT